jgi:hypothetical protein
MEKRIYELEKIVRQLMAEKMNGVPR